MNLLKKYDLFINNEYPSPFLNEKDVFQDGTVPFCRDKNGKLWAIAGHSHMGHIGVFCGDSLEDMDEAYPATFNFCVGHADYAFSGVRYPEGVKARGSMWVFGLYICPKTNRFFALFHNETGWNGKGTAYDAFGLCETPTLDSDFRHVGLIHSDDEGKTWTFDRWVLSGENVCFTENFVPDGVNETGQKTDGEILLGSGDFSLFTEPDSEYVYLFYDIIRIDIKNMRWKGCDAYVARARKRKDGVFGDFVKYYNGAFCEAGNFGKESVIVGNAWHPRVAYFKELGCYVMSYSPVVTDDPSRLVSDVMELRTSSDLINWSEPIAVKRDGKPFGNHYQAITSFHGKGDPYCVEGGDFTVLSCHNGTDVTAFDFTLKNK